MELEGQERGDLEELEGNESWYDQNEYKKLMKFFKITNKKEYIWQGSYKTFEECPK